MIVGSQAVSGFPNPKACLALRQGSPAYADIRENVAGIPRFAQENGTATRDLDAPLK